MSARLVVIALDSFDKDLLLAWAGSGELPALGGLLQRATWGIAEAPLAVYAGAVWPSFNTGTFPSRHRRFFRRQSPRGEYLDAAFTPHDVVGVPFWEILSAAGRRVAVLDVPHCSVAKSLNGIQLVDWGSHEPELGQALTYPAGWRDEVIERFGIEPPDFCEQTPHTVEGYQTLDRHLKARLDRRIALTRHYLQSDDWDLLIVTIGEAHCAGHQWWHLHDPTDPQYDAGIAAQCGDLLKQTYVAVDQGVGEIVSAAGSDAHVVVVGTHGIGPLCNASVVLDEILRRLEPSSTGQAPSLFSRLKQYWYTLPNGIRSSSPARWLKERLRPSLHQSLLVPERHRRQFFAIPHNPHAGAVRINLRGREAHGVVQPEEYRKVCDNLRNELLRLTCPETGADVVEDVYKTKDIYDGPFVDELPDLLVEWKRDRPVTSIESPRIGTLTIPTTARRSGDHKRDGFYVVIGPGHGAGRVERHVPIVDFAPTFCAILGTTTPPMDGVVIPELLPRPRTDRSPQLEV